MENEQTKELEKTFTDNLKGRIKKVPQDELRDIITNFLETNIICTLATCSNNIPRSTPLRYRAKGLTIYFFTEGGGKVNNIRENPRVSVSLYGEYSGFQSVRCLQIWGEAKIIEPEDEKEYNEGKEVLNMGQRDDLKKLGMANIQHRMKLIKIETHNARYLSFPEGIINQVLTVKED